MKDYELPELDYGYDGLEPFISEKLLKIHHDLHHQGYVDGANKILKKLVELREKGGEGDVKALLKALSYNVGGVVLHSLFWGSMKPGGSELGGELLEEVKKEFGSVERFKQEFSRAAKSVEGSGWAVLAYCKKTGRLMIMQVEKHNNHVFPGFELLMCLDVWEHAYYLDYENKRGDFVDKFWSVVDWKSVNNRLVSAKE